MSSTWHPVRVALPRVWAGALTLLLLGPALGRGFVLTYDMVFVPQLGMRPEFWGLGSGVPRAVPSDAVVALLDTLVPGMVLQKLVLVGALLGAAEGALRLVGTSTAARLTAVSVCLWNPFTVERLWMGHWTVLVGYAVLPWLALAGRQLRSTGRLPVAVALLPLGSLSASAGLVSALVLLVTGWPTGGRPRRVRAWLLGLALAANAPWLVSGALHAGSLGGAARTDLFGLHREGSVPGPLAALTLGGIWNADVVPDSRTGVVGWVSLLVFAVLAALGARAWWRRAGRSEGRRVLLLAASGYAVALLTWLAPGGVDWLAARVPGAGVVRDGTRMLGLCLPLWVGILAAGAETLTRLVAVPPARVGAVVTCCLLPLALLPEAAWGISGRLAPSAYPSAWTEARTVVAPGHGDVLVLPFSSYRAPVWNHGRTVIDPLGRFLRPDFLVNDELVVSGQVVASQDPRVARVRRALRLHDPTARAAALARLGVGWVAVERETGAGEQPRVAGTVVLDRAELGVVRLAGPIAHPDASGPARAAVGAAWLAFFTVPFVGAVATRRRRRRVD